MKKDLSFEEMHYEKLLDDKRFQVAKDLFVQYRTVRTTPLEPPLNPEYAALAAIADSDIFMAEYLGKDKAVSLPSEKVG